MCHQPLPNFWVAIRRSRDWTGIWSAVLAVNTNPFVGVGYQSFWAGDRLATVWVNLGVTFLNQAHNGYLEDIFDFGPHWPGNDGCNHDSRPATAGSSQSGHCQRLYTLPDWASLCGQLCSVNNVTESALGPSFLWSFSLRCRRPRHRIENENNVFARSETTPPYRR